ncbi:Serine--tRNA ligase, chloroplastic/mitochondrial [Neolecta irregularis DAH-3]|uniref:serine--tRNA ligase n=1 Tax=Neolecta irregularis (strain DAH-3) TaxID=1198029 RepID=A0A1U7LMX1_NEOID|nr:Serine--tRNA ligase, chloroplastic/mitochondrial [Neolecta irregularis DAH-3]|eukprot:OLL23978.1 Serine--tRNA ligase, chloroplastic/mitochondrial [Neolecta irregularis DAH-3]
MLERICFSCRARISLRRTKGRKFHVSAAMGLQFDYKFVKENSDSVIKNCIDRKMPDAAASVPRIIALYNTYAENRTRLNELNHARNNLTDRIQKADKDKRLELLEEAREIKPEINTLTFVLLQQESELTALTYALPNDVEELNPVGPQENARTIKIIQPDRKDIVDEPRDHFQLARDFDLLDIVSAAQTTGHAWYFLKNEAVLLEQALIQFVLQKAIANGYLPLTCPSVIRRNILDCCGFQPRDRASHVYAIEGTDLCLSGTAELPMAGMFKDHMFQYSDLPRRYVGVGKAFRREAGSRGLESKGLYRVHEFTKLELFAWSRKDESEQAFDDMIELQANIINSLELHARIIQMPSEELGAPAFKKWDIEVWMPGRGDYGEVSSTSHCTDYQSRRLNIRYSKDGSKPEFVHTLNGTAAAIPRLLVAIIENGWDKENDLIQFPAVLKPWMGTISTIRRKK